MTPERYQRLMRVFDSACQHTGDARAAFLDEACGSDEALRLEAEELLAANQKPGGLFEKPASDFAPALAGNQIGPYRIENKLGEGGMGAVYRAHDIKLNRPVAIKFLTGGLTGGLAGAEARRRFQREAQLASSLNHPHIVSVYDAGEIDGRQYLVTEYIDGGTLRDWAKAEKRTWRQIVELIVGVADGLATAHAAGILHRDIKPANILIHRSGYAKLADFGLAKLAESPVRREDAPTVTAGPTRPGIVVGTPLYMSPEQASGKELDARSDIFSFGIVLYELLAAQRPFGGASDLETLHEILLKSPPPLGHEIPAALSSLVEKALEKQPSERYRSMHDVVVDLRRLLRHSGDTAGPRVPGNSRRWVWTALPPVLLLAGFLGWRAWRAPARSEPLHAVPLTTLPGVQRSPSISPDGNHVAFSWAGAKRDNTDIYVQMIGSGAPLRLTTDPGNDYNPVWSPDGRSIAFLRRHTDPEKSEVRLIPPLGGPERKLAEIRIRGGFIVIPPYLAWCPDGKCLVVTDSPGEGKIDSLFVIATETGERKQLTHPRPPAGADTNPVISPDGSWLVFRRPASGMYTGELFKLALGRGMTAAGEPRRITPMGWDASFPAWIPGSNEILFSAGAHLWRQTVPGEGEPARLPFVGEDGLMPVVSRHQPGRPARLVYVRSFADVNLWRVDVSTPGAPASSPPAVSVSSTRQDDMPQLSPDGRRVAFTSTRSGSWEIWTSDLDGSNSLQLTLMEGPTAGYPHWSPDGERIAFHSTLEGQWDICTVPAAGGPLRNLTHHPARDYFPSFSRDGRWIYFNSARNGASRIWKMPAAGGDPVQVTNMMGEAPQESPDGAYLYFVQTIEGPSALWRMPTSGGGLPEKVLDGVILANFVVLDNGVYYIDRPSGGVGVHYLDKPSGETRLRYYDFRTRNSTTVVGNLGEVDVPLASSRDGRTILYPRVDSSVDDLMLVENFR